MSELGGLWKHKNNQHALVPPKMECGCPSGGEIKNGHLCDPPYGGTQKKSTSVVTTYLFDDHNRSRKDSCSCCFFLHVLLHLIDAFCPQQEMAKVLSHPRVYSFLHVPVQSASDSVLMDMRREYCCADFKHVADFLKER